MVALNFLFGTPLNLSFSASALSLMYSSRSSKNSLSIIRNSILIINVLQLLSIFEIFVIFVFEISPRVVSLSHINMSSETEGN